MVFAQHDSTGGRCYPPGVLLPVLRVNPRVCPNLRKRPSWNRPKKFSSPGVSTSSGHSPSHWLPYRRFDLGPPAPGALFPGDSRPIPCSLQVLAVRKGRCLSRHRPAFKVHRVTWHVRPQDGRRGRESVEFARTANHDTDYDRWSHRDLELQAIVREVPEKRGTYSVSAGTLRQLADLESA